MKVRLRLHVEEDLLSTRVTPSPRKRDPALARMEKPHRMTARQLDLWSELFPLYRPGTIWLSKTNARELADLLSRRNNRIRISVTHGPLSSIIEISKITPTPHKHNNERQKRNDESE